METVHFHFESIDSTNAWAKQNIRLFERHKLTLISSNNQTAGRGQYGREWVSPHDLNIYASFCFFMDTKKQDPLSLTHVLAISLCELLQKESLNPLIKWPNDVKIGEKKIAGILCETVYCAEEFGVIIGLGFNVNMPADLLNNIDQPATSLYSETGNMYSTSDVLHHLKEIFVPNLDIFLKKGFSPFTSLFKKLKI